MQDEPTPAEILAAVATLLRDVLPAKLPPREAFDARVAANALDLVGRQVAHEVTAAGDNARARLVKLLGVEGTLAELNRILCARIAAGELGLTDGELMQHLWSTTLDKLAVDQPGYASYRRALEKRERNAGDQKTM